MIELSRHVLKVLRKDEEFILYRAQDEELSSRVLVLATAAEYPRPESLNRLEHACSLKEELDTAWAARPIGLARHWEFPLGDFQPACDLGIDHFAGGDFFGASTAICGASTGNGVLLRIRLADDLPPIRSLMLLLFGNLSWFPER